MSTIVTDTITGKSTATTITIGSTPVVSASANSMTIRGEGSNQTSIQQGLAKAWLNLKGTDTFGINDSFNVSSCVDDGTGDYTVNINSAYSNDDFSSTSSCKGDSNNKNRASCTDNNSSSQIYLNAFVPSSANLGDLDEIHFAGHGDLA